ncbi:unnamed protein product [Lactuca saligna]|uniref:Uncharacterized protein n=1 Tax=Lactuca saligna TaxID=75948 RepID=A0AA35Z552_LACSI|nr:unnamed protein product [Lactuca saligna]
MLKFPTFNQQSIDWAHDFDYNLYNCRESLNAPGCDAIHIIEIETDIDYDTFIPSINTSEFQLWYSSFPQLENGIRHSFTTYVRVKSSGIEAPKVNGSLSECHSDSPKFDARMFSLTNRNNLEGPKNGKASTLTISKKLKLEDLIGYDLAVAVSKEFATAFPDRTFISPIVDLLRKNWRNGNLTVAMTDEEIVEIVLFPVVNEACRVLEEKIVVKASDLDIASVLGMSFRSYRCGIVFWADVGSKHIYTGLKKWFEKYGNFYKPSRFLEERAMNGVLLSAPINTGSRARMGIVVISIIIIPISFKPGCWCIVGAPIIHLPVCMAPTPPPSD